MGGASAGPPRRAVVVVGWGAQFDKLTGWWPGRGVAAGVGSAGAGGSLRAAGAAGVGGVAVYAAGEKEGETMILVHEIEAVLQALDEYGTVKLPAKYAEMIERVKGRLQGASVLAVALEQEALSHRGEVVRLRQVIQVMQHAHGGLVCGLWQRGAITEGEAARLLGVDRVTARQMSEDLCLPWYGEPAGPLAPLYVEILEAAEAS